jgi:hypothetical protein
VPSEATCRTLEHVDVSVCVLALARLKRVKFLANHVFKLNANIFTLFARKVAKLKAIAALYVLAALLEVVGVTFVVPHLQTTVCVVAFHLAL